MKTLHTRSHVGSSGILKLNLPTEIRDSDVEVVVILHPVEAANQSSAADEDWERFIEETAGRWQGEPLVRPEQGDFEERNELA